jgi:hypothetical protein
MVNIQKAALDQLQMQHAHSDVLPLLSGQNLTAAAAAAANLGGGMTAPLPQSFNVGAPAAASNGFGLPSTSMGLAHMSSMDAMSFQAAMGAVSSNPLALDGMGMSAAAGGNGSVCSTSGLVSQLMASAQEKQQQAAAAASTATILEELSRQLAALEMQQSSQSAPLPQLHAKVAAAAMGGLGGAGDHVDMAGMGPHHPLGRMPSDAGPQALQLLQEMTWQGTPPHGRPEASGGSFTGRRPEPSGGSFSLGRPEASGGSFTLGANFADNLGVPAAGRKAGFSQDMFNLHHPWAVENASSSMPYGLQQQQQQRPDMSAPLPSMSSNKMKPWSAPASPSTTADGNENEQLSRADVQLGSLSFSTGVPPPAKELLAQPPKGLHAATASGAGRFLSLPLQQLMNLQPMSETCAEQPLSEELPAAFTEPGSNQSLGVHSAGSATSAADAMPLMVIGDAPIRSDQLRDKVLAPAAAEPEQVQPNGMAGSQPDGAAEAAWGGGGAATVAGLPNRPPISQGSIGVEEAAKLLGQLPEDSVRQLLDMVKAQHPQLAST